MDRTPFEKQCDELDSKVEGLTEFEKKFYLWRLLDWYSKDIEEDLRNKQSPKTVSEMYALMKMRDHSVAAKEMTDILLAELF